MLITCSAPGSKQSFWSFISTASNDVISKGHLMWAPEHWPSSLKPRLPCQRFLIIPLKLVASLWFILFFFFLMATLANIGCSPSPSCFDLLPYILYLCIVMNNSGKNAKNLPSFAEVWGSLQRHGLLPPALCISARQFLRDDGRMHSDLALQRKNWDDFPVLPKTQHPILTNWFKGFLRLRKCLLSTKQNFP